MEDMGVKLVVMCLEETWVYANDIQARLYVLSGRMV